MNALRASSYLELLHCAMFRSALASSGIKRTAPSVKQLRTSLLQLRNGHYHYTVTCHVYNNIIIANRVTLTYLLPLYQ